MRGLGLVMLVVLVGCQQPETVYEVERSRSFTQSGDATWSAVERFLADNGFTVEGGDRQSGMVATVKAGFEDLGWADCPRQRYCDSSSDSCRPARARPIDRVAHLDVTVLEPGSGSRVDLDARIDENQRHPYRGGLPLVQPCRSKGVLERALLEAVGPAPAPTAPAPAPATSDG